MVMIIIAYKLIYDMWKYRRAVPIDHWHEWKNMAAASILPAAVFAFNSSWPWIWAIGLSVAMIAWTILVLFDGLYGVCRKLGFFYTGGKGKGQSKWSAFFANMSTPAQAIFKISMLGLLITLFIISL